MTKYFTVWYTKNSDTIYSDVEIANKNEAIKFAEKNVKNYDDATVFRVTETERRKNYKMVEVIFNN